MSVKVIVFDLDGTLFDTRADIVKAVNRARASFGLEPLDFDRVVAMVGNGVKVLAERVFRDSPIVPEIGHSRIMEFYAPDDSTAPLYPGVAETLPKFSAQLTIVSNKPTELVHALLQKNGLDKRFAYVAGGDTFPQLKPDPAALHFIMERFQVSAKELLVVGDHTPDIEMARAAGAFSVYCNYGFFGKDLVGAEFTVDSFPELLDVVRRIDEGEIPAGRKKAEGQAREPQRGDFHRRHDGQGRQRQGNRGQRPHHGRGPGDRDRRPR
ncbi:MAG: HAD family hydrolase [Acidobacteria bacterium]|nr:MAG: HAD family hydrolase [Acidobacteriota bacterium]